MDKCYSLYIQLKKRLEKLTWLAQRSYYSERINEIKQNSKMLWKTINEIVCRKSKKGGVITHLKTDNGGIMYDPKQIADELNNYFVQIGKKLSDKISPPAKTHMDFLKGSAIENTFFLSATNPFEVDSIVSSFNNNKAMGPDSIPIRMLKAGLPILAPILSKLINECFEFGIFPQSLKIARVTPLFKGGSKDSSNCYRPISIISPLSKLIEKLISKRLVKFLDKFNIIKDNQYGFRSAHSTNHAIATISEKIRKNLDSREHTVSIFLDLSKAFDCVNHNILLDKLKYYGIRGVALEFFRSYLNNRQQFTIVNGVISDIFTIICGVPQGSTLGPLLFLLYINDISTASKFISILFADDTCLIMNNKNLKTLEEMCNRELKEIDVWFRANKLTANINKASKFMLSTASKNQMQSNFQIKMGESCLERVKSIKYLGVMIDDLLSWNNHAQYLNKKLSSACGILGKIKYYVDVPTLITIYFSFLQKAWDYRKG